MRSIRSLASIDAPHVTLKPFEADGALDLSSERVLLDKACERLVSEGYSHYSREDLREKRHTKVLSFEVLLAGRT